MRPIDSLNLLLSAAPEPSPSKPAKPAPKNDPFSRVVPDFSVFGADFTTWWQKLLAGLWGLSIVVSAAGLLIAALKYRSQKTNGYAQGTLESAEDLKRWGVSAGIIVGAGVIFGGLVAVFG